MSSSEDKSFYIILFYKYVDIAQPEEVVAWHETRCAAMTGRVLISKEGVNGNLSGERADVLAYQQDLAARFPGLFADGTVQFKSSTVKASQLPNNVDDPFPDLRLKLVDEVISTGGVSSRALHFVPCVARVARGKCSRDLYVAWCAPPGKRAHAILTMQGPTFVLLAANAPTRSLSWNVQTHDSAFPPLLSPLTAARTCRRRISTRCWRARATRRFCSIRATTKR
jgi:hypothetical protein